MNAYSQSRITKGVDLYMAFLPRVKAGAMSARGERLSSKQEHPWWKSHTWNHDGLTYWR